MRRVLAALAGVTLSVALPITAEAATYASSGERCTIVGTAKADTLRGTSRADVICGLGGNDVLIGDASNDILDGGSGDDTLRAGGGNDRLIGGSGRDTMYGGDGGDSVSYTERTTSVAADLDGKRDDGASGEGDLIGTDIENLSGGSGADRLTGSSKANKLYGGDGSDVLRGEGSQDVLSGGSGHDKLYGGWGYDTLSGGDGNDVLVGDTGADTLRGDAGNDDLDGSAAGVASLDGGSGTNTCGGDGADTFVRCAADAAAPVVVAAEILPNTVDVTSADRTVVARLHLQDDTGVVAAYALSYNGSASGPQFADAALVSGTTRDGIWEIRGTSYRYSPPGKFNLSLRVQDRAGNEAYRLFGSALTVTDANPDTTAPVVESVTLSSTSVNVSQSAAKIKVQAHLTDNLSGAREVTLCGWRPFDDGHYWYGITNCPFMKLTSGTTRDGVWAAELTIPKGAPSGLWNVSVALFDRANHVDQSAYYIGEDAYADQFASSGNAAYHELAGARFTVAG